MSFLFFNEIWLKKKDPKKRFILQNLQFYFKGIFLDSKIFASDTNDAQKNAKNKILIYLI